MDLKGFLLFPQRSARQGRPKAGLGAERAQRAQRARSAITKNRLKKNSPHKDQIKKKIFPYPRFPDFSIIRTTSQKKYAPFPKYFSQGLQRKKNIPLFLPQTSYHGAYQIHVPMGQGVSQSCFPIQNLLYFKKIIIKFHQIKNFHQQKLSVTLQG